MTLFEEGRCPVCLGPMPTEPITFGAWDYCSDSCVRSVNWMLMRTSKADRYVDMRNDYRGERR